MLQILFERGFVDPSKPKEYYTMEGRKDKYGNIAPETSLHQMIMKCADFAEEETLLQFHGRNLGAVVDRTPKCHPEMAGEGIEYSWGCAKGLYRRLPIAQKKSKEKFRESVRKCLSREHIQTKQQQQFSRRARQYMLAYLAMETDTNQFPQSDSIRSSHLIEKIIKQYKSHRAANDFDTGYINKVVAQMKEIADPADGG